MKTDFLRDMPRSARSVCTSQVQNSTGSPCVLIEKRLPLAAITARMNSCGLTCAQVLGCRGGLYALRLLQDSGAVPACTKQQASGLTLRACAVVPATCTAA